MNKDVIIDDIKVIQAPLAGISDKIYRGLIRKTGSKCLMTTEMLSSEMLCNNPNLEKQKIVQFEEFEYPLAFQLVGHKIDKMTRAAKLVSPYASMIDINCGCPVRKVVVSGDGSAMMRTPKLACDIVKSIKDETNLKVSVKFRLGWSKDEENYIEFASALEGAGADFVTLHARTRSEMYEGSADWSKIALLKKEVNIPVFANGDIKTLDDALNCLEITKCDGVSIGRGIMGDFTLPYRIEHYFKTGEKLAEPGLLQKINMLKEHLNLEVDLMGEINAVKFMRKFYPYYICTLRNASKYRQVLVSLNTKKEIEDTLDEILRLHNSNNA